MKWPHPDFDAGILDPGTRDCPLTSRGGKMKGYGVLKHNGRDSNLNMQGYSDWKAETSSCKAESHGNTKDKIYNNWTERTWEVKSSVSVV